MVVLLMMKEDSSLVHVNSVSGSTIWSKTDTDMKLVTGTDNKCCKRIKDKQWHWLGYKESWTCGSPATYTNGTHWFCTRHSKMQRYVLRKGDVGEIISRYDTEAELREAYRSVTDPEIRMQKISKSRRRDIY